MHTWLSRSSRRWTSRTWLSCYDFGKQLNKSNNFGFFLTKSIIAICIPDWVVVVVDVLVVLGRVVVVVVVVVVVGSVGVVEGAGVVTTPKKGNRIFIYSTIILKQNSNAWMMTDLVMILIKNKCVPWNFITIIVILLNTLLSWALVL